jgi:antitoxin (DNA-binding transcriptional repressor) of toxin-antitoxin stability system
VAAGGEIVIAKAGRKVARLVPLDAAFEGRS